MNTLFLIFLAPFLTTHAIGQVESVQAQTPFLQTTALKFYCRYGSVLNEDVSHCTPKVVVEEQPQQTVQEKVVEVVRNVFVPVAGAQEPSASYLEAMIRRIVLELMPTPQTIVIKGEKGDKGDPGVPGTSGSNLQAFEGIQMPFWNGYGSGPSTGGGSTVINNVTNIFGSSSTSTITADNGLTINPANNVQLGGSLIQDTLIDLDTRTLTLDQTATSSRFKIQGASGYGVGFGTQDLLQIETHPNEGFAITSYEQGPLVTDNHGTFLNFTSNLSNPLADPLGAYVYSDRTTGAIGMGRFAGGVLSIDENSVDVTSLGTIVTNAASLQGFFANTGNLLVGGDAGYRFRVNNATGNDIAVANFDGGVGLGVNMFVGQFDPNGQYTADPGSFYYNLSPATDDDVLWVKGPTGGFGTNVGWVPVQTGTTTPTQAWLLAGNGGTNPATDFIGTTDGQDLVVRTNNTEVARFGLSDNFSFGYGSQALSSNMNVMGNNAGTGAINAANSNFFGIQSGAGATNASMSNFIGFYAGNNATNATVSNFIGASAGNGATNASEANFIGDSSGFNATNATYSNFIGYRAGFVAANASNSNFIGNEAGNGATDASNSNFFGQQAGLSATNANNSNFIGFRSGLAATGASEANFFGSFAGQSATNAANSNFFGESAGQDAVNASNSNFFGFTAGQNAANANRSNFLGDSAGQQALNAQYSNFFGYRAGENAPNAANSIFIGRQAGLNDTVNNTVAGTSILIGNFTSTGGFSNSIALGEGVTNTASNQLYIRDAITNFNLAGVNYTFPTTQGATGTVLVNDGTGVLSWTTVATTSTSTILTADNGLTINPANNIQLGGRLIQNTSIETNDGLGGFFFEVGPNAGEPLFKVDNASNTATLGDADNWTGGTSISADITNRQLRFVTADSGNTPQERMRIDGNGNVGIGTSTATEKLDIVGNVRFSGALMPNNLAGATGTVLLSQGAGLSPVWAATSSLGFINHWQKNTNVLSPTDAAVYQIAVANNAASTLTGFKTTNINDVSNYAGAVLELKGSGADFTNNVYFGKYGANFYIPSWAGNGVLATDKSLVIGALGTSSVINFQVTGGYASPISKMTLSSTTLHLLSTNFRLDGAFMPGNNAGATGTVLISQGSGLTPVWTATSSLNIVCPTCIIQNGNSFGATTTIGTNDNFALAFETNGVHRLRIATTGKMLWNNAPDNAAATAYLANFYNNTALEQSIIAITNTASGNTLNDGLQIGVGSGVSHGFVYNRENAQLALGTNGGFKMFFDPSGNIGVNTGLGSVPGNTFEIQHGTSGNSGLRFTNLLSSSATTTSNGKVLTVNASGDVVLVDDGFGNVNVNCSSSTTIFCQNGNSFGTAGVLGTNDAFGFTLETVNTPRITIGTTGQVNVAGETSGGGSYTMNVGASTGSHALRVTGTSDTIYAQQGAGSDVFFIRTSGTNTYLTASAGNSLILGVGGTTQNDFFIDSLGDTTVRHRLFVADTFSGSGSARVGQTIQSATNSGNQTGATTQLLIQPNDGGLDSTGTNIGLDVNMDNLSGGTNLAARFNTGATNTLPILTIANTAGDFQIFRTDVAPENFVTGSIGDIAVDGTNGKLYIKSTGIVTSTGWLDLVGNNCSPSGSGANNECQGTGALQLLTTGYNNVAFGDSSLANTTIGYANVAVGFETLLNNVDGFSNVSIGTQSLRANTSGFQNTAIGVNAMITNTTGSNNTAVGMNALYSNTTGIQNTAMGLSALYSNSSGVNNTANGMFALQFTTTGGANTAMGASALRFNITGNSNVGIGVQAALSNTTGSNNVVIGRDVLTANTTGSNNVVIGMNSLNSFNVLDSSGNNTVVGYSTGGGITTGINNTIIGANVIGLPTTLSNNIILADGSGNRRINVDSTGNVGIGTTTPLTQLHVVSGNTNGLTLQTTGNAALLDFRTTGVTPANRNWRLVNNFSTGGTLEFHRSSNAVSDPSIVTARFTSSGNFGLNVNPGSLLSVNGNAAIGGTGYSDVAAPTNGLIVQGNTGIGTNAPLFLLHTGSSSITSGTTVARFENAGGTCDVTPNVAGGITCTSDQNLKKDIESIDPIDILTRLLTVEVKSYRMNADTSTSTKQTGFLAQQLETQFPGLVLTSIEGTKSVSYAGMTPILTQAIQTLYKFMTDIGVTIEGGVAKIGNFFAKKVTTEELCVGNVCVTESQFLQMVQSTQAASNVVNTELSGENSSDNETINNTPEVSDSNLSEDQINEEGTNQLSGTPLNVETNLSNIEPVVETMSDAVVSTDSIE